MSAGWRTGARAPCRGLFLPWTLRRSHGRRGEPAGRGRAGTAAGRAPRRPLPPWDASVGFGFIFNNVFPSGLSPPTLDSVAGSSRGTCRPPADTGRGAARLWGEAGGGSPAPPPPPGGAGCGPHSAGRRRRREGIALPCAGPGRVYIDPCIEPGGPCSLRRDSTETHLYYVLFGSVLDINCVIFLYTF